MEVDKYDNRTYSAGQAGTGFDEEEAMMMTDTESSWLNRLIDNLSKSDFFIAVPLALTLAYVVFNLLYQVTTSSGVTLGSLAPNFFIFGRMLYSVVWWKSLLAIIIAMEIVYWTLPKDCLACDYDDIPGSVFVSKLISLGYVFVLMTLYGIGYAIYWVIRQLIPNIGTLLRVLGWITVVAISLVLFYYLNSLRFKLGGASAKQDAKNGIERH